MFFPATKIAGISTTLLPLTLANLPRPLNKNKAPMCYIHMDVSKNRGTPKSSILIGFSIINHPFWGTTISGNTYIYIPGSSFRGAEWMSFGVPKNTIILGFKQHPNWKMLGWLVWNPMKHCFFLHIKLMFVSQFLSHILKNHSSGRSVEGDWKKQNP